MFGGIVYVDVILGVWVFLVVMFFVWFFDVFV